MGKSLIFNLIRIREVLKLIVFTDTQTQSDAENRSVWCILNENTLNQLLRRLGSLY